MLTRDYQWLCSCDSSHYFVAELCNTINGEQIKYLRIKEVTTRDSDEIYDEFREYFDYKSEWIHAVRYDDYEDSYEDFIEFIDNNYWDYIDQVIDSCSSPEIVDWVQENVDSDYNEWNIDDRGGNKIELADNGTFANYNYILSEDNFTNLDERNDELYTEILTYFGKCDYKYMVF